MNLQFDFISGACGVSLGYDFGCQPEYWSNPSTHQALVAGAGFALLAYIDNDICRKMYVEMKNTFPILYQSPVRINKNTDNDFFFCIYDVPSEET